MTMIEMPEDSSMGPSRWGLKETLLWSLAILGVYVVFYGVAFVALGKLTHAANASFTSENMNGNLVIGATCVADLACIPLIIGIIKRKLGAIPSEYLALKGVSWRVAVAWIGILLAYVALVLLFALAMGQSVLDWLTMKTFNPFPSLWLVLVAMQIVAPLFEEIMFRGFIYYGLEGSRVGTRGAIIVTAVLFGLGHTQYNALGIITVIGCGILFGMARARTGSIYLTMLLHTVLNAIPKLWAVVDSIV